MQIDADCRNGAESGAGALQKTEESLSIGTYVSHEAAVLAHKKRGRWGRALKR